MNFDQHAFISYAHIDNEPLTPEQRGWVTQFHATLQTMLSQRLGEKARIWRDQKLDGSDIFGAEITDQLARTALLVSILSPRYLRSEWCTRELREFCEAAARHGGLTVGNRSRVVKVVKTPVEATDAALPEVVQRTLGHEFFAVEDGRPKELDPAFGDLARQQFLAKLSSLAWDLASSLQALADSPADAAAGGTPPAARKPVIFLADCGRDLRDVREQVATDLRMHGYELLPAHQLPPIEETLVPELRAQLARCGLAVHLVGRSVGPIPDGPSERSLVMLENELAAECARQGKLRRILWLPLGTSGERPEQQAFIDALQRDADLQAGADLLTGDVETLKGTIHATLRRLEAPPPAVRAAAEKAVVHVLMSEADRSTSLPLLKALRARGLDVTIPVFSGDAAAVREANGQLVAGCDALMLFYGAGDEVWKFHQQNEVRRVAATTGHAALRSPWLCLAQPSTPDKEMLASLGEPNVLDVREGVPDTAVEPLLAALAAARPGA